MYTTFLSILFWLCGSFTAAPVCGGAPCGAGSVHVGRNDARIVAVDDDSTMRMQTEFAACCMECNCDLRLPRPCRSVGRGAESPATLFAAVRAVRCTARFVLCDALHGYYAGRVTRLFEFDLYRSSLRADFFLHSLCWLRI